MKNKKCEFDELVKREDKLLNDAEYAIIDVCQKANDRYHELYDEEIQEQFRREEALMEEQERLEYEDFLDRQKHDPSLQP